MQSRNLSILVQLPATYTTTASWANVTGMVITVPEDGDYDITVSYGSNIATNARGNKTRIAIGGNEIKGTLVEFYHTTAGNTYIPVSQTINNISLKTAQVVSLMAVYDSGAGTIVFSTAGEAYIQITKRGV